MESLPESNANAPRMPLDQLPLVAPCRPLPMLAPLQWLRDGWSDMHAAKVPSLLYGVVLGVLSASIAALTWKLGLAALYLGMASGFAFIGPLLAMGLYSISYQLENGRRPTLLYSLREGRAHLRDTLVLGLCLLIVLLVWARAATVISVFFPATESRTWRELAPFLGIGTAVGAVFAAIVFAATAFSLPMLLDRRADAITAVVTSINATLRNKRTMLVWGSLIAVGILIGFATMLIGFVVIMPLIGHATWHAYRAAIDASMWPATHQPPRVFQL